MARLRRVAVAANRGAGYLTNDLAESLGALLDSDLAEPASDPVDTHNEKGSQSEP